ncbi:MAG: HD domain-containing protein [Bdellovibrionia bacterium]
MRHKLVLPALMLASAFVFLSDASFGSSGGSATLETATGIPLNTAWKQKVYEFAKENIKHPSWGLSHSERDYQVTLILAQREGLSVDSDVLFASAFLHDVGGLAPFEQAGVDHAVRSVQVIEPLLSSWGFPKEKWSQVKEMILGHTYYGPKPSSPQALAFRDADILDFLGDIGVARILAITQEQGRANDTLGPTVDTLKSFADKMAKGCSLMACREMAKPRQRELEQFLISLHLESFGEKAL